MYKILYCAKHDKLCSIYIFSDLGETRHLEVSLRIQAVGIKGKLLTVSDGHVSVIKEHFSFLATILFE